MSYFLLPKINNIIDINPSCNEDDKYNECDKCIYISNSIFNYYCEMKKHILNYKTNDPFNSHNNYNAICKIANTYEFIHSPVPGSNLSISKIKSKSSLFFELLEIFTMLNFGNLSNEPIRSLHITKNNDDIVKCFDIFREKSKNDDIINNYDNIEDNLHEALKNTIFDFIFFEAKTECDSDQYIFSLCEILLIILKNQSMYGNAIIKINETFHKPVIEILYILSELYNKVYIIKPNVSNSITFDKYIVCKNFKATETHIKKLNYIKLIVFLKKLEKKTIQSLLNFDIPYLFFMKIDEINNIIGQQILEGLDLIVNLLKNKEDKIESIKKINIQKAIMWCEKYNVPHNKVFEKSNIFLPLNNKLENENEAEYLIEKEEELNC